MYEYPYGDNQQLNLDWFLTEFKNLVAAWEAEKAGIDGALDDEIARAEAALADVFAARDAAAASATAAAGSASSAGTSATAAGNSATAAAANATLANNKAAAAGLSEANAAQSASNASASETTASNAATAAAASATAAAASEANAAASQTAAANSATAAATSETNAAASAQTAEDVLESIPQDYSDLSAEVAAQSVAIKTLDLGKELSYINTNDTHREIAFLSTSYSNSANELEIECTVDANAGTNANISVGGTVRGSDNLDATITDAINAGNIVIPNVQSGYKLYAKMTAINNLVVTHILVKNDTTLIERWKMQWYSKPDVRIYRITVYTNNSPLSTTATLKYKTGEYSSAF